MPSPIDAKAAFLGAILTGSRGVLRFRSSGSSLGLALATGVEWGASDSSGSRLVSTLTSESSDVQTLKLAEPSLSCLT